MYIVIEESGQFSKRSRTKNFVIGAFAVDDIVYSRKKITSWFTNKFIKFYGQNEVKWSSLYIPDRLRLNTLRYIKDLRINIQYEYINNTSIPIKYYTKDGLESGMLYIDLIKNIFKKFHIKNENTIYLLCDKRPLKNIKFETFKSLLSRDLHILCGEKVKMHINVINSHEEANIQIADWIAGAISRFLEKGHLWKEIGGIFNLKIDN